MRVGVLGLGELGRDAARKLEALGFDVAGWSASAKVAAGVALFPRRRRARARCWRATDILVVPAAADARRRAASSNAALFAKLKQGGPLGGPVLINAGRGGLQVEADILAALAAGVLKGASLDVFETEPLPANSPLWAHPAVFVSPHNAAISAPRRDRRRHRAADRGLRARRAAAQRGGPRAGILTRLSKESRTALRARRAGA